MTLAAPSLARVGRDGLLRLRFERRGGRTVLAACRCTVPLQVMAPLALDDPAAIVSVLNPTGGLVGGDRLLIEVIVEAGAHACMTTPSATKVYRTAGPDAEHEVRLLLGPGATLEWVPDHTILFAGSALRQRIEVRMAESARLIVVDAFAAGRVARDEAWRFARLDSAIGVRDEGGWRFRDRIVVEGADSWSGLGFAEAHAYVATVVAAGPGDLDGLRRDLTALLADRFGVIGGAGALRRDGVVARVLAVDAPALQHALDPIWARARRALLGLGALDLRKA